MVRPAHRCQVARVATPGILTAVSSKDCASLVCMEIPATRRLKCRCRRVHPESYTQASRSSLNTLRGLNRSLKISCNYGFNIVIIPVHFGFTVYYNTAIVQNATDILRVWYRLLQKYTLHQTITFTFTG
jgi:3-deoxy-D-manno-octulosonic acid (KDO) 8-phosphate synthase